MDEDVESTAERRDVSRDSPRSALARQIRRARAECVPRRAADDASERQAACTRTPRSTSDREIAAPMPRMPPVTSAARPSKSQDRLNGPGHSSVSLTATT